MAVHLKRLKDQEYRVTLTVGETDEQTTQKLIVKLQRI